MTAAHYKGGHPPGNDLGLHYTALPPIVASSPYSDQLLVTRKFWSPGANRPSQASDGARKVTNRHGHDAGGQPSKSVARTQEKGNEQKQPRRSCSDPRSLNTLLLRTRQW